MTLKAPRLTQFLVKNRFISILVPLLVVVLVQPLVADQILPGWVTKVATLLVILGAYRVLRKHRVALRSAVILFGLAAIALPTDIVTISLTAHWVGALATVAALTIVIVVIAYEAVTERWVTQDTLLGSLAVYLLIGITVTYVFELIELYVPGSFSNLNGTTSSEVFAELNYHSLVTLTTLGYGDIAPVHPFARILGALEAIVGQFFVAAVVGLLISRRSSQPSHGKGDASPTARPSQES